MRIASLKGMAVKGLLGTVAMGAMLFAGTRKAEAQIGFGIQIGNPGYVAPAPYYGGYDGYYNAPAPVVYGGYAPYAYAGRGWGDRDDWHDRDDWRGRRDFVGREGWGRGDDHGWGGRGGWGRGGDHRR